MSGELGRDVVHPPAWPVAAAAASAIVALTIAVLGARATAPSVPLLVAGYVFGAVVTVALSAVFRALRDARRKHPRFRVNLLLNRLVAVVVGVGFLAGLGNAFLLATELAK